MFHLKAGMVQKLLVVSIAAYALICCKILTRASAKIFQKDLVIVKISAHHT